MITNKDLLSEIKEIDRIARELKTDDPVRAAELKAQAITVKLLHNLRTNMVIVMKHLGITLVTPTRRTEDETERTEG